MCCSSFLFEDVHDHGQDGNGLKQLENDRPTFSSSAVVQNLRWFALDPFVNSLEVIRLVFHILGVFCVRNLALQ